MEIAVLIKPVPEAEARLRPDASGRELESEGVKFVLAGYDESAVEQALLLKEAIAGATVHAVSSGPPARAEEVVRAALALGADRGTVVEAPPTIAHDPVATARALALALTPPPALILLGKQSLDSQSGLLPSALAALLDRTELSPAVDLRWDAASARFRLGVIREEGRLTLTIPPPLVVGLQEAWNDPRTAKLPMILKSRRATLARVPLAQVEAALSASGPVPEVRPLTFRLPPPRTGARLIEYKSPEEAAARLVQLLGDEAKVLP
jgi:electron transfer flavoprotein beta subunit